MLVNPPRDHLTHPPPLSILSACPALNRTGTFPQLNRSSYKTEQQHQQVDTVEDRKGREKPRLFFGITAIVSPTYLIACYTGEDK